jgi:hypothetical protein
MTGLPAVARTRADGRTNPPAFIIGAPRSGTSLLYKLLCMHPDAAWISNWNRLAPAAVHLGALTRLSRRLPARRRAVWFGADSNAYVYGRRRSLADRVFPMPVEGEPLFVRCGLPLELRSLDEVSPASVSALRRMFDRLQRYGGGSIVVSKRIANNYRIPALLAAFPEARFVHLVRDGRAVAPSLRKVDWWPDSLVPWYGDTPTAWEEAGGDPWEIAAREWVEEILAVERGLESASADQVLTVQYETLVSSATESLDTIASFVGLEPDARWRAEVASFDFSNRAEAGDGHLSADVRDRIEQWQRSVLERYGYVV